MSEVLSIVAVFHPAAGKTELLRSMLSAIAKDVQQHEKGALRYEVTEQVDAKGEPQLVVVEDYENEAAFTFHTNQQYFVDFFNKVQNEKLVETEIEIKKLKKFGGFASR